MEPSTKVKLQQQVQNATVLAEKTNSPVACFFKPGENDPFRLEVIETATDAWDAYLVVLPDGARIECS